MKNLNSLIVILMTSQAALAADMIRVADVPLVGANQRLIVVETDDSGRSIKANSESSNQNTNINHNQNVIQNVVQPQPNYVQQPTTLVEASPLGESKADRMRMQRQQAELETERRIVEKLEESRLADEARRADRLFGDRLQPEQAAPVVAAPIVVTPAPVVQVPAVEQIIDKKVEVTAVKTVTQEDIKIQDIKTEAPKAKSMYMSALMGMAEYPDALNIDGNTAIGFSVGSLNDNLALEGSFIYSKLDLDKFTYSYREIQQMNIGVTAKYVWNNDSKIRPLVGATASYTTRNYQSQYLFGFYQYDENVKSTAFDVGLVLGVDFQLNKDLAIGLDYRTMINISNDADSGYFKALPQFAGTSPVEEIDYQIIGLSGKFSF